MLEKPSGSDEEGRYGAASNALPVKSTDNNPMIKVGTTGDLSPVQDFEAMMSRRDSPDWVGKAITDMKNKIYNLVEVSCEGDNYLKALECLVALRKGCIHEQVCVLPFLDLWFANLDNYGFCDFFSVISFVTFA